MVDIIALAVSHALLLIAAWRLLWREDLNHNSRPSVSSQKAPEPSTKSNIAPLQNGYRKMKLGRHGNAKADSQNFDPKISADD